MKVQKFFLKSTCLMKFLKGYLPALATSAAWSLFITISKLGVLVQPAAPASLNG